MVSGVGPVTANYSVYKENNVTHSLLNSAPFDTQRTVSYM
jgi:hypothetical protein